MLILVDSNKRPFDMHCYFLDIFCQNVIFQILSVVK